MKIIKGVVKEYAWGQKGVTGLVGRFSLLQDGLNPAANSIAVNEKIQEIQHTPLAELWMGTHPNGTSTVELGQQLGKLSLKEYIELMPVECLGKKLLDQKISDLPFLFKILSVRAALSIQAHPNKATAEKLHKENPALYKDANHKPELAIALTPLTLLVGFKTETQFNQLLEQNHVLKLVLGKEKEESSEEEEEKQSYSQVLKKYAANIFSLQNSSEIAAQLISSIKAKPKSLRSQIQQELLNIAQTHGNQDQGLLLAAAMNLVTIERGKAVFIPPHQPHAYLRGNLVECMACSDNVVRGGLTPKTKDVPTLLSLLQPYEASACCSLPGDKIQSSEAGSITAYCMKDYKEFGVYRVEVSKNKQIDCSVLPQTPIILICTSGGVEVKSKSGTLQVGEGQSAFIPAAESELSIRWTKGKWCEVFVAGAQY